MVAAWISCGTQLQKSSPAVTVMPSGSAVKKIWINATFRTINCSYYVHLSILWKKNTKTLESCNKFLFSTCFPMVRIVKSWYSFPPFESSSFLPDKSSYGRRENLPEKSSYSLFQDPKYATLKAENNLAINYQTLTCINLWKWSWACQIWGQWQTISAVPGDCWPSIVK